MLIDLLIDLLVANGQVDRLGLGVESWQTKVQTKIYLLKTQHCMSISMGVYLLWELYLGSIWVSALDNTLGGVTSNTLDEV